MSDEQRFEALYAEHVRVIAAYVGARTDRESATDALARTFEVAWRRLADAPEAPRAWLFGIARRVLSEQRRAAGRHDALLQRIGQTIHASAEDHADGVGDRASFLAALSELAPQQREALLLVAWDGLNHREAATVLGCSPGTLAVRLHRARRDLRRTIGRATPDSPDLRDPKRATATNCPPKEAL